MDERHLCRGKNRTGWHIGNIVDTVHGPQIFTRRNGFTGPNDLIDADTIGRCTGLKDNNGAPIFEGDIISGGGEYDKAFGLYVVKHGPFQDSCGIESDTKSFGWFLESAKDKTHKTLLFDFEESSNRHQYYVVGNVHDNKELIQ